MMLLITMVSVQGQSRMFSQSGIDPLNQTWVSEEKIFGASPENGQERDKNATLYLEKEKKQKLKKNWSAPAPPSLRDLEMKSRKATLFQDVRSQLYDINESVYGGISIEAKFRDYTKVIINNIEFQVKGSVYFNKKTGTITGIYSLKEAVYFPTKYGNVLISGWASFTPEGKLKFVCPALEERDFNIGGITVPYTWSAGGYSSKIFFHENGNIQDIHIAQNIRLDVYGRSIVFKHHEGCGGDLSFYKNEKFRGGYLAENTLIDGVYYPADAYIEFWDNGRLRAALGTSKVWKKTLTIQGVKIGTPELGGGVLFTREGELASVMGFGEDTTLYEKAFKRGQSMKHYINAQGQLVTWVADIKPGDGFYIIDPKE